MAFINDVPGLRPKLKPLHEEDGLEAPDPGIAGQPPPERGPADPNEPVVLPIRMTSRQMEEAMGERPKAKLTSQEMRAFGIGRAKPSEEERDETLSAALGMSNLEFGDMGPTPRKARVSGMTQQEELEHRTRALARPGNAWELYKMGVHKPEVFAPAPELRKGEFPIEAAYSSTAGAAFQLYDVIAKMASGAATLTAHAAEGMSESRHLQLIQRKAAEQAQQGRQQTADQLAADVMAQANQPGGPDPELVKMADEAQQAVEMAKRLLDPSVDREYKDRAAPMLAESLMEIRNRFGEKIKDLLVITPEMERSFTYQAGGLFGGLAPYVALSYALGPVGAAQKASWIARNAAEIGSAAAGTLHTFGIAYDDARQHGAPPWAAEAYAWKLAPTGAADALVPRALFAYDRAAGGTILPAVRRALSEGVLERFSNRTFASAMQGFLGGLAEQFSYNVGAQKLFDQERSLMEGVPESMLNRGIAGFVLSALGGAKGVIRESRARAAGKAAWDNARSREKLTAQQLAEPDFVTGFYAKMPKEAIELLVADRPVDAKTGTETPPSRKDMAVMGLNPGPDVTAEIRQRFSEDIRKMAQESTLREGKGVEITADDILAGPLVEHMPDESVRRLAALPEITPDALRTEGLRPDDTITPAVLQDMHVRAKERAETGQITPRPERVEIPVRDEEVAGPLPERLTPPPEDAGAKPPEPPREQGAEAKAKQAPEAKAEPERMTADVETKPDTTVAPKPEVGRAAEPVPARKPGADPDFDFDKWYPPFAEHVDNYLSKSPGPTDARIEREIIAREWHPDLLATPKGQEYQQRIQQQFADSTTTATFEMGNVKGEMWVYKDWVGHDAAVKAFTSTAKPPKPSRPGTPGKSSIPSAENAAKRVATLKKIVKGMAKKAFVVTKDFMFATDGHMAIKHNDAMGKKPEGDPDIAAQYATPERWQDMAGSKLVEAEIDVREEYRKLVQVMVGTYPTPKEEQHGTLVATLNTDGTIGYVRNVPGEMVARVNDRPGSKPVALLTADLYRDVLTNALKFSEPQPKGKKGATGRVDAMIRFPVEENKAIYLRSGKTEQLLMKRADVDNIVEKAWSVEPKAEEGETVFTHEMREGGSAEPTVPGKKIPNIANIGEADTGPAEVSAWAQKRFPGLKHSHSLRPADVYWLTKQLSGNEPVLKQLHENLVAKVEAGQITPKHGARLRVVINSLYKPNDPHTVVAVMHEIGHLIAIMPDGVLDLRRGGVLNHIKGTMRETGRFMKEYPGSPFDVITRDDVKRLRNEARKIASKKMPVEVVPEFVTTRLKVAAKDILDVFNRLTWDHLPKDLVDYIKRMGNRDKALAVKAAMESAKKGTDLPPEFDRFTKEIKTPTGKVSRRRAKPTSQDVKEQFQELLTREIEKRHLFDGHVIRKELLALSRYWRPDERPSGDAMAKKAKPIDRSAKEIYADGVMSLLFAPNETKSRAPHFWDAFWNYLSARPKAAEALIETQGLLSHSESDWRIASKVYRDRLLTGMKDIGDQFMAIHNAGPLAQTSIMHRITTTLAARWKDYVQYFVEKLGPVRDLARKERKEKGPAFSDTAMYAYHLATQVDADGITKSLAIEYDSFFQSWKKRGVTLDDLTTMLQAERIISDRADLWNPHMWDAEEANRQLTMMKDRLSPEQWQNLQAARTQLHEIVYRGVQRALEEGYIDEATFNRLDQQKDSYAAFMAAEYLLTGKLDPEIHAMTGNPGESGNPLDFTIIKSLAFSANITRNTAKRATIDQLIRVEPDKVVDHVVLKRDESVPRHSKPGYGWMTVRRYGVRHAYQIPRQFIDSFSKADSPFLNKFATLASDITYNVWHPLFVTYNPTFGVRNIFRDFNRSWNMMVSQGKRLQTEMAARIMRSNPGISKREAMRQARGQRISVADLIEARIRKAPEAWRVARGIDHYDDYIKRVVRAGALPSLFTDLPPSKKAGRPVEMEMRKYGIDLNRQTSRTPIQKLLGFFNLPGHIRTLNAFTEALPKMADWSVLDQRGVPDPKKAVLVRKLTGTPDIAQRGILSNLTNAVYMYSKVRTNDLDAAFDFAFSKDTAASWWGHFVTMSLLPKIATVMALENYFGDDVREIMEAIPKYYLEAYNVIPLGWHTTEDGRRQAVAMLGPQNELHAVLGTAVYRMLRNGDYREMLDAIDKARPYNLSPPLKLISWSTQLAMGLNPTDDLGRPIVNSTSFAASQEGGSKYLLPDFLNMFLKTSGVGYDASWLMGVPQMLGSAYEREGLEALVKSPGVRALVIVTDKGIHESAIAANEQQANLRAMGRADLDRDTKSLLSQYSSLHQRYLGLRKQGKQMQDTDWRRYRILDHNKKYIDRTLDLIHAANAVYQNRERPLEDRVRAKERASAMYLDLAKRSASVRQKLKNVGT